PSIARTARNSRLRNDARGLAGQIMMARMRAAETFGRTQIACTISGNSCKTQLEGYGSGSFTDESNGQVQILSAGNSFGIPAGVSSGVGGQSGATPTQSANIIFNSRGVPIDNSGAAVSNYALYLKGDSANSAYIAISVDLSGRATLWNYTGSSFIR